MSNSDDPESPTPLYNIEEGNHSEMEDKKMINESDWNDKRVATQNEYLENVDEDLQYQDGWLIRR